MGQMVNGNWVNTMNPKTLSDEASSIHSCFCKMPDNLLEITTISGRKIKATGNHPFLVENDGVYEWKNAEDLIHSDKVVIRHTIASIQEENDSSICLQEANILDDYKVKLSELNLIGKPLSNECLKIIARLVGLLHNQGNMKRNEDLFFSGTKAQKRK